MASLGVVTSRQVLAQRVGRSVRSVAVRSSRPMPFSGARRVLAKAQGAEAPAVSDAEMAALVEDEDDVVDIDSVYSAMVGADEDDDAVVNAELDADELAAAIEAAELLSLDGMDALTAAEVSAQVEEDGEMQTYSAFYAAKLMDEKLQAGEVTADELSSLTELTEDVEEVELEDMAPAQNSDRFAEVPASAEDKEAMVQYKLSKPELRNLLPEDWDQINVDFFSNKKDENIPLPEFRLNVLWTDKNLAVAIDQVYSRGQVSPLTEYYFWPRQDAWEDLRMNLEARPWISERDRIILLNRLTQLINYWQDEEVKHSVDEARAEFPDCAFAVV